jgi:hypothetical protein
LAACPSFRSTGVVFFSLCVGSTDALLQLSATSLTNRRQERVVRVLTTTRSGPTSFRSGIVDATLGWSWRHPDLLLLFECAFTLRLLLLKSLEVTDHVFFDLALDSTNAVLERAQLRCAHRVGKAFCVRKNAQVVHKQQDVALAAILHVYHVIVSTDSNGHIDTALVVSCLDELDDELQECHAAIDRLRLRELPKSELVVSKVSAM